MLDEISFGVVRFVAALVWTGENFLGGHLHCGLLRLGHTEALVMAIGCVEAGGHLQGWCGILIFDKYTYLASF